MTRRQLLHAGLGIGFQSKQKRIAALLDPNRLPKFVNPLVIPGRALPSGTLRHPSERIGTIPLYQLSMREFYAKVHPDLPATRFWGFDSKFPGPTIEARRGQPIWIEWVNRLPATHFLPIDHSLHGSGKDLPPVRTVVHVHGARVPSESDGYPENWFTPGAKLRSFYPNIQDSAMLWYHDHAMGLTRLNLFAGLFGLFLVRDEVEDSLGLPSGDFEIPLILCDRSFQTDGQLTYPVSGNPVHPWVPEVFGEAVLANGKLFPYCDVKARTYRLRFLNASNSRFLYLSFSPKVPVLQVGCDQGLLERPIRIDRSTLAPGERADLVVDFSGFAGSTVVVKSDAFTIMQFRVGAITGATSPLPQKLRPVALLKESDAVRTRILTLDSGNDSDDPSSMNQPMLLNGSRWFDPVTEMPTLDTVEIWSFLNTTDDSHPIHLHLVRFQILDRRSFDVFTYLNEGQIRYTAPAIKPDPEESGWKDTVRADPGVITRIIVRFEGFSGRYVWHCHVLEHEDFEMMRPYDVLPPGKV
jgi:spore coat protein A, manganese oxidase